MSIFPALLALVAILGLIGSSAIQPLLDNLGSVAPRPAKEILTNALTGLQSGGAGAGVLFVVALAGAIWSASGYVSAFMDASNTSTTCRRAARSGASSRCASASPSRC